MKQLSIAILGTGLRLDNHHLNRNPFWRKSTYFQDFHSINLPEKKTRFFLVFAQLFWFFFLFFSHLLINLLYHKYIMVHGDTFYRRKNNSWLINGTCNAEVELQMMVAVTLVEMAF